MSDSMATTVLTVDPTGKVGAVFSGHVQASGLDLPEGVEGEAPEAQSYITWRDAANIAQDAIVAWHRKGTPTAKSVLQLIANIAGERAGSVAELGALGHAGEDSAVLRLNALGSNPSVAVELGGELITVLEAIEGTGSGEFRSKFLQLRGSEDRILAYGTSWVTFAGSRFSETQVVEHLLGRAPIVVLPTSKQAPAFGRIPILNAFSWDEEVFQVNGETSEAFTGFVEFSWIAIA